MKRILLTTSAIAMVTSGAAFAGSLAEPIVQAPVLVPTAPSLDWTGGYAGIQLGYGNLNVGNNIDRDGDGDVDIDDETFAFGGPLDGDGAIGGVHVGYLYDFGSYVLGGELDYNAANIDLGDNGVGELDSVTRAKLKFGYDAGQALIYGVLGAASAKATIGGGDFSETGYLVGVGVDYLVSPNWVVGGEVVYHDFGDDFDGLGVGVDATTVQLRASYKF